MSHGSEITAREWPRRGFQYWSYILDSIWVVSLRIKVSDAEQRRMVWEMARSCWLSVHRRDGLLWRPMTAYLLLSIVCGVVLPWGGAYVARGDHSERKGACETRVEGGILQRLKQLRNHVDIDHLMLWFWDGNNIVMMFLGSVQL